MISEVTGVLLSPNPALPVLSLDIKKVPSPFRTVVKHILLAARLMITRHWKLQMAPNPSEAIALVNVHFSYDHTLALWKGNVTAFDRVWKPWSIWIIGYDHCTCAWCFVCLLVFLCQSNSFLLTSTEYLCSGLSLPNMLLYLLHNSYRCYSIFFNCSRQSSLFLP